MTNPKGIYTKRLEDSDCEWRVFTDHRCTWDSYIGMIDRWEPGVWYAYSGRYGHMSEHKRRYDALLALAKAAGVEVSDEDDG